MREKALATASRADPSAVGGQVRRRIPSTATEAAASRSAPGSPISWTPSEVRAGQLEVTLDGRDERASTPGRRRRASRAGASSTGSSPTAARGLLANASNVLDPTWEAPDGTIVPLDGFLDPYFQEVYLEAESIPLFSRLVKELSADAVDDYVDSSSTRSGSTRVEEPNYGKAARRMYNVFRLTGRYAEAAYLRELFDEPVTALYQVAALIRTIDEAASAGDVFEPDAMVAQVDALIMSAIAALEGRPRRPWSPSC